MRSKAYTMVMARHHNLGWKPSQGAATSVPAYTSVARTPSVETNCRLQPLRVCRVSPKLSRSSNAPRFHRSRWRARSPQVSMASVDMVAVLGQTNPNPRCFRARVIQLSSVRVA